MFNKVYNQLFIESENNELFIYVHLDKFSEKKASDILDKYIDSFRKYEFEKINISFWNVNIPGEHLSSFRKTTNGAIARILKGFKVIDSYYDFKDKQKVVTDAQLIV